MTVLVTGASGHLGRLTVQALLARGLDPADIRAGARDLSRISDLTEVGVVGVELDYDRPETVAAAVAGADSVLLVSGSEVGRRVPQHTAVIEAAAAAGVSKLVYTSVPKGAASTLVLAPEHVATEAVIARSGVPAVILRNNWYTENYGRDLGVVAETGVLAAGTGDGRVASASRQDFAEAAAAVLVEDGHLGQVYELGGDVAWTYADLAVAIGEVLGREVTWTPLDAEQQKAGLAAAGVDEGTAGFVVALDAGIAAGELAGDGRGSLSRLIGRPTTPLVEGLRSLV